MDEEEKYIVRLQDTKPYKILIFNSSESAAQYLREKAANLDVWREVPEEKACFRVLTRRDSERASCDYT